MDRKEYKEAFLISSMKNTGHLIEKDPDEIEYQENEII